jgi:Cache 3/Cache 2 fusion domain
MVCLSHKRLVKSSVSQSSPELTAPAFESRDERARLRTAYPREVAMRRLFLVLSLLLPVTMLISSASMAETKLDASILSYDGKDFVRTETTLMQDGQSAVGTKLDHDSPAYKALAEKHSYTGPATVFGKNYQGNYAPLIGADGKLTGALFVGVAK